MTGLDHSDLPATERDHKDVDALSSVHPRDVVLFELSLVFGRLPPLGDVGLAKPRS